MAAQKAGFETTFKPTIAKPTIGSTNDVKGVARQRMRVAGRRVTDEEMEKEIIRALERPMTTGQLAKAFQRTPKSFYRDWLKPMFTAGKIEKQGDYWKRPGAAEKLVQREHVDDIVKRSDFAQLPILEDLVSHMKKITSGSTYLAKYRKICTGKELQGFKCRPEHWTADTTQQFVKLLLEMRNITRVPPTLRQLLRYVHEDVLHQPLTDQQKRDWGLDGKKDSIGLYSHVRMTESQIVKLAKFYLDKGDLQVAGYVALGIECFGRPAAMRDAETRKFQLTERTITRATIQGWPEPIYDAKTMPVFQALALRDPHLIKIETFRAPAVEGQLYENKTEDLWPKRVLGEQAVKIGTELLQERRNKPLLFNWQNMTRDQWEAWLSKMLRDGYREIGVTNDYFTKKPMYSLRHVGAQMWLNRTGYDYAGVAEMGWRDIATLHRWYGGYSMEFFNQKVAVAYS